MSKDADMHKALLRALKILRDKHGTDAAGAEALGVARQNINDWKHRTHKVSYSKALALAQETGVSVHELRPDVFGPETQAGSTALAV